MPRPLVLLAALLALLPVAGCGGGDDKGGTGTTAARTTRPATGDVAQYRGEVTRISTSFAQAGRTFRDSVGPATTPRQAANALEAFQTKVNRAAGDLGGITPVAGVAGPHKELVAAFRGIASACQPAIDAGRAGDRPRLRAALRRLQSQLNGSLGDRAKQAARQIDAGLAGQ